MITKLQVTGPKHTPVEWWDKVFPKKKTWTFKEGVNILWGPNGSGKTTILKLLARMMHCDQGGISTVTHTSVGVLAGKHKWSDAKPKLGVKVEHDGKPVVFYDPHAQVGLDCGGSAFDWDFGMEGIQNAMMKGSSGELAMARFNSVMQRIGEEIEVKVPTKNPDDWTKLALGALQPAIEEGQRTILMDEPDANLDWRIKLMMWDWISGLRRKEGAAPVQFIIATHSPMALRVKNAHYIEMKKGYKSMAIGVLKIAGLWTDEHENSEVKKEKEESKSTQK